MPPFSESFGRRRPYLYSAAAYCVGNIVVAAVPAPSSSGVFLGRFISGLASAVPAVVVAGSIEDMFDARKRIWLIWTWELGTVLALAVGPIYGSYITANVGW
jgi:MFS family permease